MESPESLQHLEITALQSIYAEDFIECPPPKAWKGAMLTCCFQGAARLPEFIIRVCHPVPEHASKVNFNLHVKFPKTYPRLASPIFSIEKPTVGINDAQVSKLMHAINSEAQRLKGFEMVFSIVAVCQDWIEKNIQPPVEVVGSLAVQMTQRAMDEEKLRREKELEQAQREALEATRAAVELNEQIQADAMRQFLAQEQQYKSRRRANSAATEVPSVGDGDTPMETFQDMTINGVHFNTVKLYNPKAWNLGLVYMAEPIVDNVSAAVPLELYMISFEGSHYSTIGGKAKLSNLAEEMKGLLRIRHPKILTTYGVKLNLPAVGHPQLVILTEKTPSVTLHDILEECDSLREDRATDYITQILTALSDLHDRGFVHRGINARSIGLVSDGNNHKSIKLCKVSVFTRLLDLHRSNSFGPRTPSPPEEPKHFEGWLSRDIDDSPLTYTRFRDIHDAGVVLFQMLLGLDVCEKYYDPVEAIHKSSISPILARQAKIMLDASKKNAVSCSAIIAGLNGVIQSSPVTAKAVTPNLNFQFGSPEGPDYFRLTPRAKQVSRWKEDWEELELLGKGAYGSVVKARNKIDSRIYAVKKIRLKTMQSDKIFREVNALSRLSHRNIVRYYTTWVETQEPASSANSEDSGTDSSTEAGTSTEEEGLTSVPYTATEHDLPVNGAFNLDDLSNSLPGNGSSFPSIHFSSSTNNSEDSSSSGEDQDEFGDLFSPATKSRSKSGPTSLEFVERQTLRERVMEGLPDDEKEGWRLFQQLLDALVHMSTLNILHRDIKLNNIFIGGLHVFVFLLAFTHKFILDMKGDCKVGDFGLATSSLAAVEPSDISDQTLMDNIVAPEMTLEVGTALYIAPEVRDQHNQLKRRKLRAPRDHSKADMYSLGIVFFEMNFKFNTGAERIRVLEDLRKPAIIFPPTWDPHRSRQREIITWLLQHDPAKRPTALELSQSPLMPERLEQDHFKNAIRLMAKPDSAHYQTVLTHLFTQPPRPSRAFVYDQDLDAPDYAPLNQMVHEQLAAIFQIHGAVDMEPPLFMPMMDPEEEKTRATFLDRQGDIVTLPNNILVPFARLAARQNIRRIKRYHITNVYRPNLAPGHPKYTKAALFDIISPDVNFGPTAAAAELISVASDCLNFPTLGQNYDIHISHSKIVEIALNRIPADIRGSVLDIMAQQLKTAPSSRRANLLKKGLLRSMADELEILAEVEERVEDVVFELERIGTSLGLLLQQPIKEVKEVIHFAKLAGVKRQIFFHPLMLGNVHTHFKDGVMVEVVRRNKPTDILAAGGRYDALIARYQPLKQNSEPICAFGMHIAVEKITAALASYQSASFKTFVKEERSFGFWSPRRCDVYVISQDPGHLQDRFEVVSYLWQNKISADLMYESGLLDADHEKYFDICVREGILFTVHPRPRTGGNLFKVKSVLKQTEVELTRQELVGWLQHQIADQKRLDASTAGTSNSLPETAPNVSIMKDTATLPDVHLVLPEGKKQSKSHKQIRLDKAFTKAVAIKNSFMTKMPVIAVDVTPTHFDAMVKSASWVNDEEAWKTILAMFPPVHAGYGPMVREAVLKRKSEGHAHVLLYSVRDERIQLLNLP
ncbi:other/PEK/GCN2 protein kinase [Agrocybe pediades]|nr:other/PEK/GCN2 protein kinase [Agrocybe pediades]